MTDDIYGRLRSALEDIRPPGMVSAYLFGSHARGTPHRESDVDVGVLFDPERTSGRSERGRRSTRLASELIGALHRNEVQVVSLLDVSPELASRVLREGRAVFVPEPGRDRSLARQILLRAADLDPFLRRNRAVKLEVLRR